MLGVNVQLEEALGHALLWIACRHHVCELLLGAVCAAVSPHTSKSPDDALSKKISNQLENNGMPALLDESCAKVFQEKSKFFVDRKKELEQLQHKLSKGGDETRYAIPRGDYQAYWDLVLVNFFSIFRNEPKLHKSVDGHSP